MRNQIMRRLGGLLVFSATLGCGGDPFTAIDAPEQLILYSLDGRYFEVGKEPKSEEKFHRHPVLGKVDITVEDKRKEIVTALKSGVARGDRKMMAACFWPRHGIRAVEKGRTIDYVICFECHQVEAREGNTRVVKPISNDPRAVFNRILTETGIPLAPAEGEAGVSSTDR